MGHIRHRTDNLTSMLEDYERISNLEKAAQQLRLDILHIVYGAGPDRKGHPGGALSAEPI